VALRRRRQCPTGRRLAPQQRVKILADAPPALLENNDRRAAGQKARAHLVVALALLGGTDWDAPPLAVPGRRRGYPLDRVTDDRILRLQWDAVALREVGRADKQDVDTFRRGDRVDILHPLAILDLHAHKRLAVGMRHVLSRRRQPI